jgi:hypothetical protein
VTSVCVPAALTAAAPKQQEIDHGVPMEQEPVLDAMTALPLGEQHSLRQVQALEATLWS